MWCKISLNQGMVNLCDLYIGTSSSLFVSRIDISTILQEL